MGIWALVLYILPIILVAWLLFWPLRKYLDLSARGVSIFTILLIALGAYFILGTPTIILDRISSEAYEIETKVNSGEYHPLIGRLWGVSTDPCAIVGQPGGFAEEACATGRGQPVTGAQAPAAANPVPGAALLPAAPAPTPVPEDPRVIAWRQQVLPQLQTASSGGTTWFPSGTQCVLEFDGNIFSSDLHWVTCPSLGVTRQPISEGVGKELRALTGDQGGTFVGSGNWPLDAPPTPPVTPPAEQQAPPLAAPTTPQTWDPRYEGVAYGGNFRLHRGTEFIWVPDGTELYSCGQDAEGRLLVCGQDSLPNGWFWLP